MDRFQPTEFVTQADQVHDRVRAAILTGVWQPGSRIRMSEIAASLDVSMGAVREALSRLSAEHMVVATAQRGYSVAALSAFELNDLTETRIALEQLCLKASIASATVEWEAALIGALHRLERLSEFDPDDRSRLNGAWSEAHREFHQALVAGCRSAWMHRFRASLYLQTERYRQLSVPLRTIHRDVAGEHAALCEAALAGDADRACELMRSHLMRTTEILLNSPLLAAAPSAAESRVLEMTGE
jgi:DNA-binding GntR family transcriptional regulator